MGFDGETVRLSTSKLFVVASPSAKKAHLLCTLKKKQQLKTRLTEITLVAISVTVSVWSAQCEIFIASLSSPLLSSSSSSSPSISFSPSCSSSSYSSLLCTAAVLFYQWCVGGGGIGVGGEWRLKGSGGSETRRPPQVDLRLRPHSLSVYPSAS